jgi:hypothetical protein
MVRLRGAFGVVGFGAVLIDQGAQVRGALAQCVGPESGPDLGQGGFGSCAGGGVDPVRQ